MLGNLFCFAVLPFETNDYSFSPKGSRVLKARLVQRLSDARASMLCKAHSGHMPAASAEATKVNKSATPVVVCRPGASHSVGSVCVPFT